jgi:hypothetical protein
MVKDLRTRPISLKVGKCAQLTSDEEAKWDLYQTQTFLPSLESLFKTDVLQNTATYGIKLSDPIHAVVSDSTVQTISGKRVDVHRKTTSILNPFRWMRGDYGSLGLPTSAETSAEITDKLQSPHTAAYVGALASVVLSESDCPNFPKVYGVYCGMAKTFSFDISDDYEDLSERPWFPQSIGKTFNLRMRHSVGTPQFQHTREKRPTLLVDSDGILGEVTELNETRHSTPSATSVVEEDACPKEEESDDDDLSTASTDDVFAIESCDCSSDGSFCEDDCGDDEPFAWADISNIPVVTTVLEKCTGTLYGLFKLDTDPLHQVAYIAQVVLALTFAQRTFGLTHNDLHGNNVMYTPTDREFVSYSVDGLLYRIPTHGYLMKIIDFDRAVFQVRLQGMREPKTFMSDQFQEDEEAGGQYNMEPFYTQKQPEYKANPSFDLVRLATSMFWDMFPEGPSPSDHPLKSVLVRWMTLPDQTSILFGKTNPKHDRYHGFHQYKAIARFCKDTAVPRKEVLLLGAFKVDKLPLGESAVVVEP